MTTELEAGSFRDREGRVFYRDGKVFRALSRTAAEAWQAFAASDFYRRLRPVFIDVASSEEWVEGDRPRSCASSS